MTILWVLLAAALAFWAWAEITSDTGYRFRKEMRDRRRRRE